MKTIDINGTPFKYEEEQMGWDNAVSVSRQDAIDTLFLAKELCEKRGLKFYLYWGTLLGAVRNHDFIPGDTDIDVYIKDEQALVNSIPFFHSNGLRLIRHLPGRIYSFRAENGCYIDFDVVARLGLSVWAPTCYRVNHFIQPKKLLDGESTVNVFGEDFYIPENPEAVLEFLYGKDWRIPKSGHKFVSEVMTAHLWHKYWKPFKKRIQALIGWEKIKKSWNIK